MAKKRPYPNQPMENGMYRIEHTKNIIHHLHVPREKHDELRKRLKENGWREVDITYIMDAHEHWTKGDWTITFPGCWTKTEEGYNSVSFSNSIIIGHDDFTKEEWDQWWEDRKKGGYVVVPTFEIDPSKPIAKFSDTKRVRYQVLERAQERARKEITEMEGLPKLFD